MWYAGPRDYFTLPVDTGAGILANALSGNGINAIYMPILMAVLGHEKFAQMMKSGYEITVLPDFASFLVKFKQAHKSNVKWFLNISEGQQTKEGIQ